MSVNTDATRPEEIRSMVYVPAPPFKVGQWVTPKYMVACPATPNLRPGQAYKVVGWTEVGVGQNESTWSIRLEGQKDRNGFDHSFPVSWFRLAEIEPPSASGSWVTPISGPGAGQANYQIEKAWFAPDINGNRRWMLAFVGMNEARPASEFKLVYLPFNLGSCELSFVDDSTHLAAAGLSGTAYKLANRKPLLSDYEDALDFPRATLRSIANKMNLTYEDGNAWPSPIPYANTILKESPMSIIPPLEIPAAPQPEPLPPESASVQVLRALVASRRTDLRIASEKKAVHESNVRYYEGHLAKQREMIEADEAKIAAAEAALAEALADIEKLGGRPEESE